MQKKIIAGICAALLSFSAGAWIPMQADAAESTSASVSTQSYINEVVALVNQERAAYGLSALENVSALNQAAEKRSQELLTSFSHTRPDGSDCSTVLDEYSIAWRTCGENIAYGYSTPEAVMEGWMNSSGHRANILSENFDAIGVGVVSQNGVLYWTQVFTGGISADVSYQPIEQADSVPSQTTISDSEVVEMPCIGDVCPVTICADNNCSDVLSNVLASCENGNCLTGSCNDVLSNVLSSCENGNCLTGSCNDVLSNVLSSCENGNCLTGNCSDVLSNVLSSCENGNCLTNNCVLNNSNLQCLLTGNCQ